MIPPSTNPPNTSGELKQEAKHVMTAGDSVEINSSPVVIFQILTSEPQLAVRSVPLSAIFGAEFPGIFKVSVFWQFSIDFRSHMFTTEQLFALEADTSSDRLSHAATDSITSLSDCVQRVQVPH